MLKCKNLRSFHEQLQGYTQRNLKSLQNGVFTLFVESSFPKSGKEKTKEHEITKDLRTKQSTEYGLCKEGQG